MGTPRNVKKQALEAKKIQEALNTDPAKVAPIEKPADELEQVAAVEVAKNDQTKNQPEIPAKGEEPKVDDTDWEKRYKGLQTRYNREVPELRGKVDTITTALENATKQIQSLNDNIQTVNDKPAPVATDIAITDEEREQYGEDWVAMVQKVATQANPEMARQIQDLKAKLAKVETGVTNVRETVVVNNERDFRAQLARKVKTETGREWLDINNEDGFHNFLAEIVPYTNSEKQEYLAQAHEKFDVDAAAKFFIDYAGPISSSKEPSPSLVPEVPEELITPETSGGNIPPIKEEKVYTTAEVDQFYSDKRKGKYKDPVEARKIEQDILQAGREGRIVNKRAYAHA